MICGKVHLAMAYCIIYIYSFERCLLALGRKTHLAAYKSPTFLVGGGVTVQSQALHRSLKLLPCLICFRVVLLA